MNEFDVVYIALGEVEARVIAGRLESEGIPTLLKSELGGLVPGGMARVRVLVPRESVHRARLLLEGLASTNEEP
ncbi:MAG: DUF2007 domain-containing protein [Chloroflexi bacterium]|nr:DUF2007 domain-containing protein [Chloroflexota bacterium]